MLKHTKDNEAFSESKTQKKPIHLKFSVSVVLFLGFQGRSVF